MKLFDNDDDLLPARATVDATEVMDRLTTTSLPLNFRPSDHRALIVSIVERMNDGDDIQNIIESDGASPTQFLERHEVVGAASIVGNAVNDLDQDELVELADRSQERHKDWDRHSERYEVYQTVAAAMDILRIEPDQPVRRAKLRRAA